ncbi:MAG: hypothetical protein H7X95_12450 [Deltaproteobacteria bacterium]|nr:hypothetical protein [Deltaproteobacteria bacterium]
MRKQAHRTFLLLRPFPVVVVLVAAVAGIGVGGCYHGSARDASRSDLTRERGWIMVQGIELVRHTTTHECGAAALSMMLQRSAAPVSVNEILRGVSMDPSKGIAAGALRDFASHKGLRAFLFKGEMSDLVKEVSLNRPALVGLVQRYGDRAFPHYEVVAGVNPTSKRLLLLDPARGLREDSFDGFAVEWEGAGRLVLVIVPS